MTLGFKAFFRFRRRIENGWWIARRTARGRRANVLFITEQNRISSSQIFPFYFFRGALLRDLDLDFDEISIRDYEASSLPARRAASVVIFQPWWNIAHDRLHFLLKKIRARVPTRRSFSWILSRHSTCDWPKVLSNDADVYVKKQIFRDKSQYGKATKSDTNLGDYYGNLYRLDYPEVRFPIPPGFLDKLVVGPGFSTSDFMLPVFMRFNRPLSRRRDMNLHARLGGVGEGWYGKMRDHAREVVNRLPNIRKATYGVVGHRDYLRELCFFKALLQPFGFGEVCWRHYEAVMCGSLLIKPDMCHVETDPDIYRPYETYIPVQWDFSDLEERILAQCLATKTRETASRRTPMRY